MPETLEQIRARMQREAQEAIRVEQEQAKARAIAVETARNAAWGWLTDPVYTEIKPVNLVVPVSHIVISWAKTLRRNRRALAARALYAIYFNISFTGKMAGTIPARLMATWIWGVGSVPDHWRTQLIGVLALIEEVCNSPDDHRLQLVFDNEKATVSYTAQETFLGCLNSMVTDDTVRFVRRYKTNAKITEAQMGNLTRYLRSMGYLNDCEPSAVPHIVRSRIESRRDELAQADSLSTLSKELAMVFMPSILGKRDTCRAFGWVARVIARNHTSRSTVTNGRIARYTGGGKITCAALAKGVTYDVFAGNGRWKNKGYFPGYWLKLHGLKPNREAKLFEMWAAAADPLKLVIVGVDKRNNHYDLAAMTKMVRAAPGKLYELNVRIYSPEDWQTRWTAFFEMPLPPVTKGSDGNAAAEKAAGGPAR